MLAPDTPQIERLLDHLLTSDPEARVLGIHSPTKRAWPESVVSRGRRFRLAWCASTLEARERLAEVETNDGAGMVVLTPLDEISLGGDVLARLPRSRLEQSDRWAALRDAFRARDVDPRLRKFRWLADFLVERPPTGGYPPASGGVLDLDTAWSAALEQILCLPQGRSDVSAILGWTLDSIGLQRFEELTEEARKEVTARLSETGGPGAALVLKVAAAGRGADALPIGLVCGVIFADEPPRAELRDAAVRLEPYVGGTPVDAVAGKALAEAARRLLRRVVEGDPSKGRLVQSRASTILAEIRADGAAALSVALDVGLDARMKAAATALATTVVSGSPDDAKRAWELVRQVEAHDRADDRRRRVERVVMAARLARWITAPRPPMASNINEAADAYAADGGFADYARQMIQTGDEIEEVTTAYARLREAVTARREEQNRKFASILRDCVAARAPLLTPLPIERLLEVVVAPLAREIPVLLIVLDGLSHAVWRNLGKSLSHLGWTEICRSDGAMPATALAALPSITEISRASLFCGRITQGNQSTERAGFATHMSLVASSRAGKPPRLFHKADLGSGPELEAPVRDAVLDPQQRVVGVVHNAIDAQLSGSDQIDLNWSAEGLRQISALLRIARDAGRVVIVTGDHGHVVEDGTSLVNGGNGDRWRTAETARDGEIALTGSRVLSPEGSQSIVAAWSEKIRYAGRRAGYHGGASPQEVLVPIVVLGGNSLPSGWDAAPPAEPGWWRGIDESAPPAAQRVYVVPPPSGRRRATNPMQPELPELTPPIPSAANAMRTPMLLETGGSLPWIDRLLASEIYAAQRRLAGRGAPSNDHVKSLLNVLAARGGRLSQVGVAQALSVPAFRLLGIVNAARRVVNLDQAQVLVIEGDDVVLNERVLHVQFGLEDRT